jgi:hypothetical protein
MQSIGFMFGGNPVFRKPDWKIFLKDDSPSRGGTQACVYKDHWLGAKCHPHL